MSNINGINEKWIKASIIGTIWAASEIVLGSFLHNLKIPFSSNGLTAIGIIILISSSYVWADRGLIWRAGLICALMKTMSPSAVIFGPMVAIFSQAVLLEFSVRIFNRNFIGFVIGAMLAMSWNLFHKIMNFIIFYGYNIVDVYANLLKYAQKQLHINVDLVWFPILALLLIYCAMGLFSAVIGIKVGRNLINHPAQNKAIVYNRFNPNQKTSVQSFNYSVKWLFFNLFFIIFSLVLLNFTPWYIWSVSISGIVLIWIFRYKRALRQLSKPGFWIYFLIITMITAFVFNKIQDQAFVNGFLIGIQMNFRAVVIILGFSVLGTELYNPVVRSFFLKTSFKQLPLALELSFKSLPLMISNIPEFKVIIKNPVSVIYQMISQIEYRMDEIKSELKKKVYIVSGSVGKGKTTTLKKLAEILSENISVGGILSLRLIENNSTIGYDILDITTDKKEPFLRLGTTNGQPQIGNFTILENGLQMGKNALLSARNSKLKIIFIDEVGKLELENSGWFEELNQIINYGESSLVMAVRDSFTEQVINKWNLTNVEVFNLNTYDYLQISQIIKEQIH